MQVTHHAQLRMKQRMGLDKKASTKIANKALTDGIQSTLTTGAVRKYLDWLTHYDESHFQKIMLYADKVFIFTASDRLITVINLPSAYKQSAHIQIAKIKQKQKQLQMIVA